MRPEKAFRDGAGNINLRRFLEELGQPGMALATSIPGLELSALIGRSPGLMLPWHRTLSRAKYPVSLLTTQTGAV